MTKRLDSNQNKFSKIRLEDQSGMKLIKTIKNHAIFFEFDILSLSSYYEDIFDTHTFCYDKTINSGDLFSLHANNITPLDQKITLQNNHESNIDEQYIYVIMSNLTIGPNVQTRRFTSKIYMPTIVPVKTIFFTFN